MEQCIKLFDKQAHNLSLASLGAPDKYIEMMIRTSTLIAARQTSWHAREQQRRERRGDNQTSHFNGSKTNWLAANRLACEWYLDI